MQERFDLRDSGMHVVDSHFLPRMDGVNPAGFSSVAGVSDVTRALRRGWLLLLFGCLIGLVAATTYLVLVPKLYNSTVRILIDRSVNRYLQINKVIDEPTFDDAETANEMYVLSSESTVLPVVRSLNLAHDPEFAGPPHNASNHLGFVAFTKHLLNLDSSSAVNGEVDRERLAVDNVLKSLTVYREDVANVINLTFASEELE